MCIFCICISKYNLEVLHLWLINVLSLKVKNNEYEHYILKYINMLNEVYGKPVWAVLKSLSYI